MARPKFSATWREETAAYVEEHRWAILGDLVAILKQPTESLTRRSRWGAWEDAVLSRLPRPADIQKALEDG